MGNIHAEKEANYLRTILARINGSGNGPAELVPEPNRKILNDFYRHLLLEELSAGRVSALMGQMYWVSVWTGHAPLGGMSREDVMALMGGIRKRKVMRKPDSLFSPATVESYKIAVKKFWRWLRNPGLTPQQLAGAPYPPEVSWIRRKRSKGKVLPGDLWTPEEVNRMAAMVNQRHTDFQSVVQKT